VAISNAAEGLIYDSRTGKGPGFLEVVTYRWYGHVDWRDDIDVGVHRSLNEVENWRAKDPVLRLSKAMILDGIWSDEQETELMGKLDKMIADSWDRAMNDPYPKSSATMDCVYA
jgi:pyruvate dehydrogenase E1 component alpha subunit